MQNAGLAQEPEPCHPGEVQSPVDGEEGSSDIFVSGFSLRLERKRITLHAETQNAFIKN